MSWIDEWRALARRIEGLTATGPVYFEYVKAKDDYHGVSNSTIVPTARAIVESLKQLQATHGDTLPPAAATVLTQFLKQWQPGGGIPGVGLVMVQLAALRAEFDYAISDSTQLVKSLTERAFIHLNREIVADEDVRKRWKLAFDKSEMRCESLGSVHLLRHGIWAFKTDAAGARTDLVLGEPLVLGDRERSAVEGLVLTEWKRAQKPADAVSMRDAAIKQAQRYSEGILAGFEVADTRYIVLVSEKPLDLDPLVKWGGVVYRVVNIAVDPPTPSKT